MCCACSGLRYIGETAHSIPPPPISLRLHVTQAVDSTPASHTSKGNMSVSLPGFPPEKNLWGGGGQLENTNLLKKGICLLNTFLKDFTKMPIKKNTVLQFDGGDILPLPKS